MARSHRRAKLELCGKLLISSIADLLPHPKPADRCWNQLQKHQSTAASVRHHEVAELPGKSQRNGDPQLGPAERRLLNDPNFITEDEADIIMVMRENSDPAEDISIDQLLKENGRPRRKR